MYALKLQEVWQYSMSSNKFTLLASSNILSKLMNKDSNVCDFEGTKYRTVHSSLVGHDCSLNRQENIV